MKVHLIKRQTGKPTLPATPAAALSRCGSRRLSTRPADIQRTFGAADLLGNGSSRVVFDIGGNHYRLIARYVFGERQAHLFVCWVGTHAEYDKLCAKGEQYTINLY